MKIIRVTYTTNLEFAERNQRNIQAVMTDLKNRNYAGINYTVCLNADGKTFVHTAFFNTDNDQQLLNDLVSFKYFQEQLKAGGLEVAPKQELLTLIGSSTSIFNI